MIPQKLRHRLPRLLFDRQGPLTRELLRNPGGFGLGQVPQRLKPDATVTMICGYCSTGCGLRAHLRQGIAVNLSPDSAYPVNLGMACPKGWEALAPLDAEDRATHPLLRRKRGGPLERISWQEAAFTFVERFGSLLDRHGPEAVAFISTGQIPSEEMALLGAFAKFGMGCRHGDANTRQCMATAATAYKEAFGFDAPPFTYEDFEESDVLVFVGANPCIAHPILWERVCRNTKRPEIIVVDPRRTETAMAATLHVPLAPKSDLALLYGLTNLLIEQGAIDRSYIQAHCSGFEELRAFAATFDCARVSQVTGLHGELIHKIASIIARGKAVSFWWTMGVNQSHEGVRTAQALINLALITGNMGRPGTGANSITGQCNAMGSRLFSNTSSLYAGRAFSNPAHRKEVADVLGISESRIPRENSLAYDEILEAVGEGKIRGLWVIGTNPAHSFIDKTWARRMLERAEFLVVQDMYRTTETVELADLVLPAAGWGEKDGTFINSERRLGLVRKVRRPPGEAMADFYIFKLLAEAWGVGDMFSKFENPEATFRIMQALSRGRPCDISGIDGYRALDASGGIQWPAPAGYQAQRNAHRRLFEDGCFFTPDGKARLCFEAPRPIPEPPCTEYPLLLLSGRGSSSQWHTQTRTGKSAVLRKLYPAQPYIEIHPEDARRYAVPAGATVTVESRRGSFSANAVVTDVVQPGQLFVPMHYSEANRLTFPAYDPYSRQPAYKACAVRISAAARRG